MIPQRVGYFLPAALLLLAIFALSILHLDRESLWYDEGWSAWVVYDDFPAPEGLRELLRYPLDSLRGVLSRISPADVHPPLYYLLLDVWTQLAGESVFSLRLLSLFAGLAALAITYRLGAHFFDPLSGLLAVLILGTMSFFLYYTREARMYTLFLALSAASMWAYLRWMGRPNRRNLLFLALSMALLLYTHYLGALVAASQFLHILLFRRGWRRAHLLAPSLIAAALFAPWIPAFLAQIAAHPNGPLPGALSTSGATIQITWLVLTSDHPGLFLLPFLIGPALPRIFRESRLQKHIALLLIWLLLTPAVLLLANLRFPVYLIRYLIAILPAVALLTAFALRNFQLPARLTAALGLKRLAQIALVGWLIAAQLTTYRFYWPEKSRWKDAVENTAAARDALQPALIHLPAASVAAYYDRQLGLREGISIDIGWRDFVPEEIHEIVAKLKAAPSIWAILPADHPSTWDAIFALQEDRRAVYRDSVMSGLFYRFDRSQSSASLIFEFDGLLRYTGGVGHRLYVRAGEALCWDFPFLALDDPGTAYSLEFSLTQGFQTVRASSSLPLPSLTRGEAFSAAPCINLPADAPRGPYHLRISLKSAEGELVPLVENGGDQALFWAYFMIPAWVSVENAAP